jgi:hypothetical protein
MPGLKICDTIRLHDCKFVIPFYNLNCSATFSTLNVGRAGTGNQTRATCVASSGTNRSAIHYATGFLSCSHLEEGSHTIRSKQGGVRGSQARNTSDKGCGGTQFFGERVSGGSFFFGSRRKICYGKFNATFYFEDC